MIVFLELEPFKEEVWAALESAHRSVDEGSAHTYVDGKYRIFTFYDAEDELAFTLTHGSTFAESGMYVGHHAGFYYCPYIPLLNPPKNDYNS